MPSTISQEMPRRRRVPGRPTWVRVSQRGAQLWARVGTTGFGLNPVRRYHLTASSHRRLLRLALAIQSAHDPTRTVDAFTRHGQSAFTIYWRIG